VSEKSAGNDVDYAAKSRMARHRAVLRWPMQFWLAKSLPRSRIQAIQSLKKEIPDIVWGCWEAKSRNSWLCLLEMAGHGVAGIGKRFPSSSMRARQ
jgi:hypothetical protein